MTWNWTGFFIVAAGWNLLIGISGVLRPLQTMEVLFGEVRDDPITLLLHRICASMVLIFGLGYLIIAVDPAANAGLIILGIIAKIWISLVWYYQNYRGVARPAASVAAIGDTLFTLAFLLFLLGEPQPEWIVVALRGGN